MIISFQGRKASKEKQLVDTLKKQLLCKPDPLNDSAQTKFDRFELHVGRLINYFENKGVTLNRTLLRKAAKKVGFKFSIAEKQEIELARSIRASKKMRQLHQDPEFQQAHQERLKRLHQNPDAKKALKERGSERFKQLHQNPEFQQALNERSSERMKRLHQDPVFQKAHTERASKHMTRLHQNPEFTQGLNKRSSERMKQLHQDPEFRKMLKKRASDNLRQLRKHPDFIAKQLAGLRAYFSSMPPKLVHQVVGNVNRATNQTIDYADPNQRDMWTQLEHAETRAVLMDALNQLKQSNARSYNAVINHYELTNVFNDDNQPKPSIFSYADVEHGLGFLKQHLLKTGFEADL